MIKVFIDGQAGTTGLQIKDKLLKHPDVELIEIDNDKRKNEAERSKLMNSADVVFLCLPDAAAIEAVKLVINPDTVIILTMEMGGKVWDDTNRVDDKHQYPNGKIEVFNSFGTSNNIIRLYNSIVFETEPKEHEFNPLLIHQIIEELKNG